MARSARLPVVVAVSLAIAATGVCSSLSAGSQTSCPVTQSAGHDSCGEREAAGSETCPEAPACPEAPTRPTCRMCDDTVAFLLKDKTAGGDVPSTSLAHAVAFAPRPAAATRGAVTSLLYLSSIASSPPLHLLNVTFRN